MERDARAVRGDLPVLLLSLREEPAAPAVASWVRGLLRDRVRAGE
jgi:urease accessory protein